MPQRPPAALLDEEFYDVTLGKVQKPYIVGNPAAFNYSFMLFDLLLFDF